MVIFPFFSNKVSVIFSHAVPWRHTMNLNRHRILLLDHSSKPLVITIRPRKRRISERPSYFSRVIVPQLKKSLRVVLVNGAQPRHVVGAVF